ncbi:hypothetical protein HY412_02000 [Candidatus Kaiserbacteria bacterium]|nr:hypothetical protein [Candidatus Kaiserbacteria bacterium]
MLYLFHGSDVEKARTKAFEWVAKARAKEPNLAYVRLASEELTGASLQDAALSGGLFVKRLLILIDYPFQEGDGADILEENIETLAASDNAIIILAPKLSAAKAKKLIAKAKFEYKYDLPEQADKPDRGFNANLVNALASRSSEKLWLEINRALYAGDEPQQIHGLLHWKARDTRDRKLSLDLITLLQSSRRGGLDLSLSLEKFALSLGI